MTEMSVGVHELKTQLSKYLRQVKAGRTIVITEHGKAVGRLVPAEQSVEEKMQSMVKAGLAEWNGKKLKPMKPVARVKAGHSVAQMIIEDRR
jgi:prevent-host-death family protein